MTPWQYGLTAAHIACKKGSLNILKKLLSVATDQKVFCTQRSGHASDCEVVLMTRAKKVLASHIIHMCTFILLLSP